MAASDKNIVISPQRGSTTLAPSIVFTGDGADPISAYALDGAVGWLSFEGSAGQLFSITNNLTSGSIFSVNDVSGIPSIDVNADGTIQLAPYGGNVGVGVTTVSARLHVTPSSSGIGVLINGTTSTDMVRITQLGTGNAFVVEDETNPDSTPFVIDGSGNTGIGISPTEKLHVSGNAIITGNLTVDTDTLYVDATNNRVGVLTTTPTQPLHVVGNALITADLIVDTDTLYVDSANNRVGIGTTTPTSKLTVNGDVNLVDGGTYSTTIQVATPTLNRTITYPDATGTIGLVAGSNNQVIYNSAGALAASPNLLFDGTTLTSTRLIVNSAAAASVIPGYFTGTWFRSGGTSTTTKPYVLIEQTGTTSTAWSTTGTGLGVNAPSGFTGNIIDLQLNGTSQFKVSSSGVVTASAGTLIAGLEIKKEGVSSGTTITTLDFTGSGVSSITSATGVATINITADISPVMMGMIF
jgi:hypothetical protein